MAQRAALEYLMTEFRAERLNTRSTEFKAGSEQHKLLGARLTGSTAGANDPVPPPEEASEPVQPRDDPVGSDGELEAPYAEPAPGPGSATSGTPGVPRPPGARHG